MNDGYYYFKTAKSNVKADKSLGYIAITKQNRLNSYLMQISLNKERLLYLTSTNVVEILLSPTPYISNDSIPITRIMISSRNHIFTDVKIPFSLVENSNNKYIIITCNGKTIIFSEIVITNSNDVSNGELREKDDTACKNFSNFPPEIAIEFDPFNTSNPSYRWSIIKNFSNNSFVSSINELENFYNTCSIQHEYFSKVSKFDFSHDTFLKISFSAYRTYSHLLYGLYTDSQSNRVFNIIGIPFFYTSKRRINNRNYLSYLNKINMYGRWIKTINKPFNLINYGYNGYWLFYFDSDNGKPVKPILKDG